MEAIHTIYNSCIGLGYVEWKQYAICLLGFGMSFVVGLWWFTEAFTQATKRRTYLKFITENNLGTKFDIWERRRKELYQKTKI